MSRRETASEKSVQAAIVELLRSIGAAVYVLGTVRRKGDHPGTMQTPGIPDIYAFLPAARYPGRSSLRLGFVYALWIEVKRPGGKLSSSQQVFRIHCEDAGHSHLVGGIDDVIAWLRSGGWIK